MLRKLYNLVSGACCVDNPDSPANHEVLLPGHLYGNLIRERLEVALSDVRTQIVMDLRRKPADVNFMDSEYCEVRLRTCTDTTAWKDKYIRGKIGKVNFDIGSRMSNFIATGNLSSPSGLDLSQASGFTIVAEKLNWYRYLSHFRCIHRGAFFATQKTTTVRKLLPEAWGEA